MNSTFLCAPLMLAFTAVVVLVVVIDITIMAFFQFEIVLSSDS